MTSRTWDAIRSFVRRGGPSVAPEPTDSGSESEDDGDEAAYHSPGAHGPPSIGGRVPLSLAAFGGMRSVGGLSGMRSAGLSGHHQSGHQQPGLSGRTPSFFGAVRQIMGPSSFKRTNSVQEKEGTRLLSRAPAHLMYEFDDDQTSKLAEAVLEGNLEKARMALMGNANPNQAAVEHHGMCPIHIVALLGRSVSSTVKVYADDVAEGLARELIKAGAKVNLVDEFGCTPVHLASYSGASKTLTLLLDSVGKTTRTATRLVNRQDTQIRYSPLHSAVEGKMANTVLVLLMRGADTQAKDSTGFTAWNLAASFHTNWAYQLLMSLCMDMAQGREVPPESLMQLALEMRQLEVVPMLIRATSKWPERVWGLLHAAIASGIEEFVELIVEDIPILTPTALLHCPWRDVMLELASRFPDCFKLLMHGLDNVNFEDVVIPFVSRLNMHQFERGDDGSEKDLPSSLSGYDRNMSAAQMVSPKGGGGGMNRSMIMSLKSLLGSVVVRPAGAVARMPEASKFLLLRNLLNSLDKLSYRVWQHIVTHMDQELLLELSRFPKLFKKLTDSIAARNVPRAATVGTSLTEAEKIKTLVVGPLLRAAIASRSSVNVYQLVTAIDKWLQRNTHCYLDALGVDNMHKLATFYPDACALLLSIQFQDKFQIKVPTSLVGTSEQSFRSSDISQAFVWQDSGLSVLLEMGLEVHEIERWVVQAIGFELLIKVFEELPPTYTAADMASDIDYLLDSGIPGLMISRLIITGTDLLDVKDALEGGLSASFIVHMLNKKVSFQVIKEMLGARLDPSTIWINVQRNPVWKKFPSSSWIEGLTYAFIRLFFEMWEKHNFDKNFIDLMFDFHDPLFVKLRTALEYVSSNKTVQVNMHEREERLDKFCRHRAESSYRTLLEAFNGRLFFPHRRLISSLAALMSYMYIMCTGQTQWGVAIYRSNKVQPVGEGKEEDEDGPKADASSEKLPILNACHMGDGCYLRALLMAKVPPSVFGLPVTEAIVNVKWVSYGAKFMLLQLFEHILFSGVIIAYLIIVSMEDESCASYSSSSSLAENDSVSLVDLASCPLGVVSLTLDVMIVYICAFWLYEILRLITNRGFFLWQINNSVNAISFVLASLTVGFHLGRFSQGYVVTLSLLVIIDILSFNWFAMMTERLGSLVRVIFDIMKETVYFLLLLGMLYVSFALAFFLLQLPGRQYEPVAVQLLTIMFGDFNENYLVNEVIYGDQFVSPRLAATLMMIYAIMLLIILFNMLVAIMNDTYQRIRSRERVEGLRNKAIILVEIESSIDEQSLETMYKAVLGKYLHSLRRTELEHMRKNQEAESKIRDAVREEVTKGVREEIQQAVNSVEEKILRPLSAAPARGPGSRPYSAVFTNLRNSSTPSTTTPGTMVRPSTAVRPGTAVRPFTTRYTRPTDEDSTKLKPSASKRHPASPHHPAAARNLFCESPRPQSAMRKSSFTDKTTPQRAGVSFSGAAMDGKVEDKVKGRSEVSFTTQPNPGGGKRTNFHVPASPKPPSRSTSRAGSFNVFPRSQSFKSINADLAAAEAIAEIDVENTHPGAAEGYHSSGTRKSVCIAEPSSLTSSASRRRSGGKRPSFGSVEDPFDVREEEEELDRKSRLDEKQRALMKRFGTFNNGAVMARRIDSEWKEEEDDDAADDNDDDDDDDDGGDGDDDDKEKDDGDWDDDDDGVQFIGQPQAKSLKEVSNAVTMAKRLQSVGAAATEQASRTGSYSLYASPLSPSRRNSTLLQSPGQRGGRGANTYKPPKGPKAHISPHALSSPLGLSAAVGSAMGSIVSPQGVPSNAGLNRPSASQQMSSGVPAARRRSILRFSDDYSDEDASIQNQVVGHKVSFPDNLPEGERSSAVQRINQEFNDTDNDEEDLLVTTSNLPSRIPSLIQRVTVKVEGVHTSQQEQEQQQEQQEQEHGLQQELEQLREQLQEQQQLQQGQEQQQQQQEQQQQQQEREQEQAQQQQGPSALQQASDAGPGVDVSIDAQNGLSAKQQHQLQ